GRAFSQAEADQNASVALIDADLAERYFAGTDPQGRSISVAIGADERMTDVTVVGVVSTIRQRSLAARDEYPTIYLPASIPYAVPGASLNSLEVVIRGSAGAKLGQALDRQMKRSPNGLLLTNTISMESRIADTIVDLLRLNALLTILSVISIALTNVGLYALLAQTIATRRRELGVRQALGASAQDLLVSVLLQGARLLGLAFLIAFPLSLLVGLGLTSRLHNLSPFDLTSYAIVSVTLLAVGAIANVFPALQASRVNPMEALRSE
ncbi:MAG: ABC transporter permease, partial [Acidobacteriota bacterium]|nr:ABC transporter permease [Acidobacteriota bacterium]